MARSTGLIAKRNAKPSSEPHTAGTLPCCFSVAVYSAAMSQSRRTVAKGYQRHAAIRAKSNWFSVAAVAYDLETPQEDLMVEHRAPALPAASSAELS